MVVIRLSRAGTKKKPFYHLAVADKQSPRDGRFIERVGFYNPIARGKSEPLRVDLERVDYWLSVGAQLSPKVKSIVARARILDALPPEPATTDSTDGSSAEAQDAVVAAKEEDSVDAKAPTADATDAIVESQEQEDVADMKDDVSVPEMESAEDAAMEQTDEPESVESLLDAQSSEDSGETKVDADARIDEKETGDPDEEEVAQVAEEVEETEADASDQSTVEAETEQEVSSEDSTEPSTEIEEKVAEHQDERLDTEKRSCNRDKMTL